MTDVDVRPICSEDNAGTHGDTQDDNCSDDLESDGEDVENDAQDVPKSTNSWSPINLVSQWMDPLTTRMCLSAAILLPSGVGGRDHDYKVRVVDRGTALLVSIRWPTPITNVPLLHQLWMNTSRRDRMTSFHPKLGGFEMALRQLRSTMEDEVWVSARIVLPFAVETELVITPLFWRDLEVRLIYLDARAAQDEYTTTTRRSAFMEMTSSAATPITDGSIPCRLSVGTPCTPSR